jgi:hypothetical protein
MSGERYIYALTGWTVEKRPKGWLRRDKQGERRIASPENVTQQATVASSRCSRCLMFPALKFPRLSSKACLLL